MNKRCSLLNMTVLRTAACARTIPLSRRQFLGQSSATAAAFVGAGSLPKSSSALSSTSPNERLNIASVGTKGRAGANLGAVGKTENIVALVDVDAKSLEEVGERYPNARRYHDFREMLEKECDNLDAVVVSTPDHIHAPATAMALRMKKHVYCEKPLTHTVFEARTVATLARQNNLVTQMGTQIHALDNYRRVVELVKSGAIGPIRDVHVWCAHSQAGGAYIPGTPVPDYLDWDLYLGPTQQRPYSPGIHPAGWRRFWDFGAGTLGDFGCHYMDLPFWALDLRYPTKVSAQGAEVDPVGTAKWCTVQYVFPNRGEQPPLKMTWYDGGKNQPEVVRDALGPLRDKQGNPLKWNAGQLFIGRHGMIISNYTEHMVLPEKTFVDFKRPDPFIPPSIGHHKEWLEAIRQNGPTTCNFGYSGALTETVLLGVVAYRSGKELDWDGDKLRVTNAPEAQALIHKEYRQGWTL